MRMLDGAINCPTTSSAGRVFDAAAGLLGVSTMQAFEGEAPMQLERLAARNGPAEPLADAYAIDADGRLDVLPLLGRMAQVDRSDESARGAAAAAFHATLAAALADWVRARSVATGLGRVAFGGGCFHNRVLGAALRARLEADGLQVFEAKRLPPSDSGLALGQAWVAAQALQ
jgi:hydrogenase maturation protein HypF